MPLNKQEVLAPLLTRFAALKAIPEPTRAEKALLKATRKAINTIRGREDKNEKDAADELEDAYKDIRTAAALASVDWPEETVSEWRFAHGALEGARSRGELVTEASNARQPTEARLRKNLRDIADGTVLAPPSVVEQAHEWLDQWYSIALDNRPSELAYIAAAAAASTDAEWEAVRQKAVIIGQRIQARQARKDIQDQSSQE